MMIIHMYFRLAMDGQTSPSIYRDSKRLASKTQVRHVPHAAARTFTVLMSGPAGLRVDWRMGWRILAPSEPDTRTLLAAASSGCPSCLPPALALHGAALAVSKIDVLRVVGPYGCVGVFGKARNQNLSIN